MLWIVRKRILKKKYFKYKHKGSGILNNLISIDNSVLPIKKQPNPIVFKLVEIFVLASWIMESKSDFSWLNDDKLSKRREAYMFDLYVQKMAKMLSNNDDIQTTYVACGNSYYKTEVIFEKNIHIHIHHSFSKNANYLKPYFEMNNFNGEDRYMYIKYDLQGNQISNLSLIIENTEKIFANINLIEIYNDIETLLIESGVIKSASSINEEIKKLISTQSYHLLNEANDKESEEKQK